MRKLDEWDVMQMMVKNFHVPVAEAYEIVNQIQFEPRGDWQLALLDRLFSSRKVVPIRERQ